MQNSLVWEEKKRQEALKIISINQTEQIEVFVRVSDKVDRYHKEKS